LEQLGRDTVEALVWEMSEADALVLDRSMRFSEQETALEQGWLLAELERRFGYSLDDLARRFDRSVSWVSRRLALLVGFAHGTAQSGPRKVAVVVDAHCLNRNAANALLKTLEEPPLGTHLLLATSHVSRLLPTIRSRCQHLVIRPDPLAARQWLAEVVPSEPLDQRLFEHGGAPLAVAAAADRNEAPLESLLHRALEPAGQAQVVGALLEAGLTDALARWSRYLVALAAGTWHCPGLQGLPQRALFEFADELTWARRLLLTSTSPNERLLAERLAARWRLLRTLTA
jgi:DNA polymerase-3 subunit delta'